MTRPQRSLHDPAAYEHDALLDAWLIGTRMFWDRRARQLEAARPRPGDYPGRATTTELAARGRRLTEAATACRIRGMFVAAALDQLTDVLTDLDGPTTAAEQGAATCRP